MSHQFSAYNSVGFDKCFKLYNSHLNQDIKLSRHPRSFLMFLYSQFPLNAHRQPLICLLDAPTEGLWGPFCAPPPSLTFYTADSCCLCCFELCSVP